MKIVIFGATGGTGRELVKQALEAGHEVTALVRNPAKITPQTGLQIIQGNALEAEPVIQAIVGQDAVLSALGGTLTDNELLPRAIEHILAGMKQHSVRRLIVLGAAGTQPGAIKRQSFLVRQASILVAATSHRKPFAAQRAMQQKIHDSDTDWTVVQPPKLLNSPGISSYRVDGEALPAGGLQISRADVAKCMLEQLSSTKWLRHDIYIAR